MGGIGEFLSVTPTPFFGVGVIPDSWQKTLPKSRVPVGGFLDNCHFCPKDEQKSAEKERKTRQLSCPAHQKPSNRERELTKQAISAHAFFARGRNSSKSSIPAHKTSQNLF